jgi:hypothetical protein
MCAGSTGHKLDVYIIWIILEDDKQLLCNAQWRSIQLSLYTNLAIIDCYIYYMCLICHLS